MMMIDDAYAKDAYNIYNIQYTPSTSRYSCTTLVHYISAAAVAATVAAAAAAALTALTAAPFEQLLQRLDHDGRRAERDADERHAAQQARAPVQRRAAPRAARGRGDASRASCGGGTTPAAAPATTS